MSNPIVADDSYSVADQTPPPAVAGFRLDRKAILAQLQGDEELLRELIRLFQDDTPRLVEEARTALGRTHPACTAPLIRSRGRLATLAPRLPWKPPGNWKRSPRRETSKKVSPY